MKENIRDEWTRIAARLAVNPNERLLCPHCRQHVIETRDVPVDEDRIERFLICQNVEKGTQF